MKGKSLVSINDYTKDNYLSILDLAAEFEKNPRQKLMEGYVVSTLFFEPSTRTRLSFESAMKRLGGEVIGGWTDEWRSDRTLTTTTTFEFVITEQIPKMKIIDFLTAIFKMFNLTAYIDETDTIVVKTLDSYYAASSVVWELSHQSGRAAWLCGVSKW